MTASLLLPSLKKLSEETSHHEFICRHVFQFVYETLSLTAFLVAEIVLIFKETAVFFFFSSCQKIDSQMKNILMILFFLFSEKPSR